MVLLNVVQTCSRTDLLKVIQICSRTDLLNVVQICSRTDLLNVEQICPGTDLLNVFGPFGVLLVEVAADPRRQPHLLAEVAADHRWQPHPFVQCLDRVSSYWLRLPQTLGGNPKCSFRVWVMWALVG